MAFKGYTSISDDLLRFWQVLSPLAKFGRRRRVRIRSTNRGTPKPRKPVRVNHTLIV